MKTIKRSIEIRATKDKIWDVITNNEVNQLWLGIFGEGLKADSKWEQRAKVFFTDSSGNGLFGRITEHRAKEMLVIEYDGMMKEGEEDTESAEAMEIKGGREEYALSDVDGRPHLSISSDMSDEYYDEMSKAWEKALQKIKELAEKS